MAKNKEGYEKRDWGDLTIEELEREGALELPDREALSTLIPRLPADPSILPTLQPDSRDQSHEVVPEVSPETPES